MGLIIYDRKRHWPNPVPYRIDKSIFSTTGAMVKLNGAISTWNKVSTLKLALDANDKAADYITFGALGGGGGGYSSSVGRAGGNQWVWADYGSTGFEMNNLLHHEIGHAVGLIHEHQRPDRDAFITSHRVPAWAKGKQGDIRIVNSGQAVGRYDCSSLMHYLDIEAYLDPKPGQCMTLSNTEGLTGGDIVALEYLAGARYRVLQQGKWATGLSHIVPFENDHREHLLVYSRSSGKVRFDRVDDGGGSTTNWGKTTWAKIWDVVITFELDYRRFVLVYARSSGLVRIDRIIIDQAAKNIRTENVWETGWANVWRPIVSLGLEGYQRDHVLAYDPGSGYARLDKINRGKNPGFGTTNVWQRKWRAGYTTVMPFRLGESDWYVLVYHNGDGKGFVYHLTKSGYKKVQDISWDKGWTHFVPYAQHSDYSYHHGDGPEPSARFLAYRSGDGTVHFDRVFKKRVETLVTDNWGKSWNILTPLFRGEAGRFHLGNDGLIAYDSSSGQVHLDQLL